VRLPDNVYNEFPRQLSTRGGSMADMPAGEQILADVEWALADFRTSPIPGMIMPEVQDGTLQPVRGLPVGRKADAVFFLHTFSAGRAVNSWQSEYERAQAQVAEGKRGVNLPDLPVVVRYLVHYQDGDTATVQVKWSDGVSHWLQEGGATDLQGAAVAWAGDFGDGRRGVLYSMQWSNPQPGKIIESIDVMGSGDAEDWGRPAIFAITTAHMEG
jgi:beta-galactosidase